MRFNNYFPIFCLAMAAFSFNLNAQEFFTEDFSDTNLTGWTTVEVLGNNTATSLWLWTDVGASGPIDIGALNSTTATNGYVIFDSDLNCSNPIGQDSWLISPAIDASDKSTIWLVFETFYGSFYDRPQIRVGTDLNNLASWETIDVFPGIGPNQWGDGGDLTTVAPSENPQPREINLSEFMAGESEVYFAFQFLSDANEGPANLIGCAYAWMVDDVALTEEDLSVQHDMRVNPWHARAASEWTPASQVEPIAFMADIENAGVVDQDNVVLTMTITDSGGSEVFTDMVSYGTVLAGTTVEDVIFDNEFTPPSAVEMYTATYSLSYDNDNMEEIPDNNEVTFTFNITENEFAKTSTFNAAYSGLDDSYSYGCIFHINNDGTAGGGAPFVASNISFMINNADDLTGDVVTIFLYEWDGDTNGDDAVNQDEYTTIGFNSYTFDGTESQEFITVPVSEDEIPSVTEGKYLIAAVQYASTEVDKTVSFIANDQYEYFATAFLTDSLERTRYVYCIDNGNEGTYNLGYVAPVIVLNIDDAVGISEVQLPKGAVALYPNPVSDVAKLDFNLETASDVKTTVLNIKGQIVGTQTWQNIGDEIIEFPTKDLANGTYLVRIDSDLGTRTLKMIVQH